MPEEDKKLTKAELGKIKAWLQEKGASGPCPICQNRNWSVLDVVVMAHQFVKKGVSFGGIPCVAVFCTRCSFLRFHSAILIGVVEPAEQKESQNG